jgi:hypothetical protein
MTLPPTNALDQQLAEAEAGLDETMRMLDRRCVCMGVALLLIVVACLAYMAHVV